MIRWEQSTNPPNKHGIKILIRPKFSKTKWLRKLIEKGEFPNDFTQTYSIAV
jgi:hypothetical protein